VADPAPGPAVLHGDGRLGRGLLAKLLGQSADLSLGVASVPLRRRFLPGFSD
jgi:hypothetical protein